MAFRQPAEGATPWRPLEHVAIPPSLSKVLGAHAADVGNLASSNIADSSSNIGDGDGGEDDGASAAGSDVGTAGSETLFNIGGGGSGGGGSSGGGSSGGGGCVGVPLQPEDVLLASLESYIQDTPEFEHKIAEYIRGSVKEPPLPRSVPTAAAL